MLSYVARAVAPTGELHLDARHYYSLAALIVLILELVYHFSDEIQYIWRSPFNKVKALYIVSRYFSCLTIIAHCIFTHIFLLRTRGQASESQCLAWFLYLELSTMLLLALYNLLLFLRVYALHRKSKPLAFIIIPIIILQVVVSLIMAFEKVPIADSTLGPHPITINDSTIGYHSTRSALPPMFDSYCSLQRIPSNITYFCMSGFLTQTSLWVAGYVKRDVARGRSILVKLVIRQGALAVVVVAVLSMFVPYSVVIEECNPFVIFIGPIVVISCLTCRLVLNMQRIKLPPRNQGTLEPHELTSFCTNQLTDISPRSISQAELQG